MLCDGTVRIGTLFSYRRTELGPAIGDGGEGASETTHRVDGPLYAKRPENRSWEFDSLIRIPEDAPDDITFTNLSIVVPEQSEDVYLYCASYYYSRQAMDEFEADTCIEVTNPLGFIRMMYRSLRWRRLIAPAATVSPCDYSGRERTHVMPRVHPAFLKPPEYAYQREIRAAFAPLQAGPIEPFVLSIPELKPMIRLRTR